MELLPTHHILQPTKLKSLEHTRPCALRSLADSNFYQFPKPLQFSLEKFGSNLVTMSSVPHTGSFQYIQQQFAQAFFSCLYHPIFSFRFSFCYSLPKQTVAEHNKRPEFFHSSISMASWTTSNISYTNNHMLLTKVH